MSPEEKRAMEKLQKIRDNIAKANPQVDQTAGAEERDSGEIEVRSNEAMSTGQDGFGQDFVANDMITTIIKKARNPEYFFGNLKTPYTFTKGSSLLVPLEGGDVTWYATSENSNVPVSDDNKSKAGTDNLTITPKKYTAQVYASGELDEDSIININSYLSEKFANAYQELLDKVWINGDTVTASTGNINSDDASPAAKTYYLHQDGLIKTARANSMTHDCGTLDLTDVRELRKKMGKKGVRNSELVRLMDINTYFKLLGLSQVETMEKFGNSATVVNGALKFLDGIKVIPTDLVGLSEADGKMSGATPANNVKGRLLLVHTPSVEHAFKRQMKLFTEYLPSDDQFRFTAHVRYGIAFNSTDGVAYGYNVTV